MTSGIIFINFELFNFKVKSGIFFCNCPEFFGRYILNEGQFAKLMTLCEFVDLYGAELGVKKMTIDANLGRISLEMFDVIFDCGVTHPFFSYIKNAEYLSFKKANDGICVTLGVERLWSKVE